jgi:hypothetical protein
LWQQHGLSRQFCQSVEEHQCYPLQLLWQELDISMLQQQIDLYGVMHHHNHHLRRSDDLP